MVEPAAIRFVADQLEALIELGRRDEAVELLEWYEGTRGGSNVRRRSPTACLPRSARGAGRCGRRSHGALRGGAHLSSAGRTSARPGRTLLALGAAQRRAKRRREARETLEEALAVFERIGAALWAERARVEPSGCSGRAATPGALTPSEERVAALVAEGKTNREVAAALFLSERTVEGHLSHVFAKLGIKHRVEVAPALASRQTRGMAASNTGDSPVSTGPSRPSLETGGFQGHQEQKEKEAMTRRLSVITAVRVAALSFGAPAAFGGVHAGGEAAPVLAQPDPMIEDGFAQAVTQVSVTGIATRTSPERPEPGIEPEHLHSLRPGAADEPFVSPKWPPRSTRRKHLSRPTRTGIDSHERALGTEARSRRRPVSWSPEVARRGRHWRGKGSRPSATRRAPAFGAGVGSSRVLTTVWP